MVDNQVACTYGVIRRHVMSDRGMLWLLTTDLVERYAVPFLLGSRDVIARLKMRLGISKITQTSECRRAAVVAVARIPHVSRGAVGC